MRVKIKEQYIYMYDHKLQGVIFDVTLEEMSLEVTKQAVNGYPCMFITAHLEPISSTEDRPEDSVSYDYINPSHYKNSSIEVCDMMLAIWGKEMYKTYCEMTAFKYRMRLGLKPDQPIERDLEKARWYEDKARSL